MSYPYFPPPPGQPGVAPPRAVSPATHYSPPPPPPTSHAPYNPAKYQQSPPMAGHNAQSPGGYHSSSPVSHPTTQHPTGGDWRAQFSQLAARANQTYNESFASLQAIARAAQNQASHQMNQLQAAGYSGASPGAQQAASTATYRHSAPVCQDQAGSSTPVPTRVSAQSGGDGAVQYPVPGLQAQYQAPGVSSPSNSSYQRGSSVAPGVPEAKQPSYGASNSTSAAESQGDVAPTQSLRVQQTPASPVSSNAQYITGEPYHYQPFNTPHASQSSPSETSTIEAVATPSTVSTDYQDVYYPPPPPVPYHTRPTQAQGKVEEAAGCTTGGAEPARAYPWMQTLSFRPASQAQASENVNSESFAALPEQNTVPALASEDLNSGYSAALPETNTLPASAVDRLSSQMKKTSIQNHESPGIEPTQIEDEDFHERPVGKPRMTMDGAPNEVFWECPGILKSFNYESDWYCLPDIPDFLICTNCHRKYLAETDLSSLLERTRRPTGRCRFNAPRLTRALLPAYRKTGDLKPIRDFMKRRLSVQDCHGEDGVNGQAGVVWYKPLDDRLAGMLSCEACYEDVILATSFCGNWGPYDRAHAANETWACDVIKYFIRRISEKFPLLPGRSWEDWVQSAANHLKQPTCQWGDDNISPSSRKWVRLRGGRVPSVRICENCYEERFALTVLDREFEFIPPEDAAFRGPDPWSCSMKYLPVLLAGALATPLGELDSFVQSAEVIAANPPCTRDGIVGGTWYTLAGGEDVRDDFKICVSCYTALFKAAGLDRFFEQVPGADDSSRSPVACSFRATAPRWHQQYDALNEALQTGVWSRFSDWVRKFAGAPPCARDEEVDDRRWYGWDECTICPECWVGFCADNQSSAGLAVELRGQPVVGRRMCCMYSPLMRQKWLAACERGSADELVEYARASYRVYAQVMPQIQMLRSQHEMQVLQSISAGQTSSMYARLAMHSSTVPSVTGCSSPYLYSNTDWGVKSAAYFSQMQAETSQSHTTIYVIEDLRIRWKAVE